MSDKELFELCKRYGSKAQKWKRRFVALLPEVYRRGLYRRKGYGSIFEFAAKLGGVSRSLVEEVIRIDEKLKDKPSLKSKIGEVGLSKVKAVAYIATKETEKEWANKVSKMTKTALETHIRDIKKSIPGDSMPITPQESLFDNSYENFTVKLDPKIIQKLRNLKANMKEGTTWNEVFAQLIRGRKLKNHARAILKQKQKRFAKSPVATIPQQSSTIRIDTRLRKIMTGLRLYVKRIMNLHIAAILTNKTAFRRFFGRLLIRSRPQLMPKC